MFESPNDVNRADWPLLRNGAVNLFHKRAVLSDAQQALVGLGYETVVVSCERDFIGQISDALRWEAQFGYSPWTGNLDALADGMSGFPFGSSRRSALVLDDFHHLVRANEECARNVLDIIEAAARDHLLWGRLLVALVRTDDPNYECANIGCRHAHWNPREWLHADRGI